MINESLTNLLEAAKKFARENGIEIGGAGNPVMQEDINAAQDPAIDESLGAPAPEDIKIKPEVAKEYEQAKDAFNDKVYEFGEEQGNIGLDLNGLKQYDLNMTLAEGHEGRDVAAAKEYLSKIDDSAPDVKDVKDMGTKTSLGSKTEQPSLKNARVISQEGSVASGTKGPLSDLNDKISAGMHEISTKMPGEAKQIRDEGQALKNGWPITRNPGGQELEIRRNKDVLEFKINGQKATKEQAASLYGNNRYEAMKMFDDIESNLQSLTRKSNGELSRS